MTRLALIATVALLSGPALAEDTPPPATWSLLNVDGQPAGYAATLVLDAAGRITGQAPCNRYFAEVQGRMPEFRLSDIGATRMACDALAQEQAYFARLQAVETAELTDARLVLRGPGGDLAFVLADN